MSDTPDPYAGCVLWFCGSWSVWPPCILRRHYTEPQTSIYAVPKPRIRIELEQGEEVE